jgi:phospholipid/cholesterol/gamma-HCH transport system permease protein
MTDASVTIERTATGLRAEVAGALVVRALSRPAEALQKLAAGGGTAVALDLTNVERLDTAGAWLVLSTRDRLRAEGAEVEITGADGPRAALLETVAAAMLVEDPPHSMRPFRRWLSAVGEGVVEGVDDLRDLVGFLGRTVASILGVLVRPWRLRMTSLVHHCQEVGLNAVPIVALMGFLIGVVLAFQGATQLRQFGAEVFVVDLISISILRELGIMLTAIIVAGRSGSAFTAAIGSMKSREEIDAMRTLGLDPMEVLAVPRILALIITLPILGLVANVCGLAGGALLSWAELGVSPGMFLTRLQDNTDVWHLGVGMIKAPVFAVVIAVVACWQGLQVGGSSEDVGRRTTASVVQAIFLVIALDAMFSVFFAEIGV